MYKYLWVEGDYHGLSQSVCLFVCLIVCLSLKWVKPSLLLYWPQSVMYLIHIWHNLCHSHDCTPCLLVARLHFFLLRYFQFVWYSFKSLINQRLKDHYIQQWNDEISTKVNCFCYRLFKTNFKFENYLITLQKKNKWKPLIEFRTGNGYFPGNH